MTGLVYQINAIMMVRASIRLSISLGHSTEYLSFSAYQLWRPR
jgi:hypothetical protein